METDTVGIRCKTFRHSGFEPVAHFLAFILISEEANKPCSSPLASSSLVTCHLCPPSPSFFPSSLPASCRYPPRSRCFSSSLSRSSSAAQGWSLRPPSSPSSRWSSRCAAGESFLFIPFLLHTVLSCALYLLSVGFDKCELSVHVPWTAVVVGPRLFSFLLLLFFWGVAVDLPNLWLPLQEHIHFLQQKQRCQRRSDDALVSS